MSMSGHQRLDPSTPTATPSVVVMLRPIGAPLPIGFLALAVGSFVLAGLQLRWIAGSQAHMVALCLLAFVVPLQLISAVFGVLARDVIAATAMAVLAGTWLSIGAVLHAGAPGTVSGALGLLLIGSAAALVSVAVTAVLSKPLATAVIGLTAVRFTCAGLYELTHASGWQSTTGLIGVLLSALAWYAALAFLLEAVAHHPILPTFRRDTPPASEPAARLAATDQVDTEAGVRSPA
jgi:succinate-acetate transporter protein